MHTAEIILLSLLQCAVNVRQCSRNDPSLSITPSTALYRVCLPRCCLSVGKYCPIVTFKKPFHHVVYGLIVHLLLSRSLIKHLLELVLSLLVLRRSEFFGIFVAHSDHYAAPVHLQTLVATATRTETSIHSDPGHLSLHNELFVMGGAGC